MPNPLQRFCPGSPTCPHRVSAQQPCPVHGTVARNSRRPTDPRYGSERWKQYSLRRRADHPFCVDCGRLADVTDHILSVRTHPELFWDESNHASRCTRCNTVKGC